MPGSCSSHIYPPLRDYNTAATVGVSWLFILYGIDHAGRLIKRDDASLSGRKTAERFLNLIPGGFFEESSPVQNGQFALCTCAPRDCGGIIFGGSPWACSCAPKARAEVCYYSVPPTPPSSVGAPPADWAKIRVSHTRLCRLDYYTSLNYVRYDGSKTTALE